MGELLPQGGDQVGEGRAGHRTARASRRRLKIENVNDTVDVKFNNMCDNDLTSVVDPNTLNLDPDPELFYQFLKQYLKKLRSKKNILKRCY